jgi:hypothetical protein
MPRLSVDVIQQLLHEMNRLVLTYPEGVERTGSTLDELIAGTAFFPGGTGLWRGKLAGGSLPLQFPERPVMFVAHNFGNTASLQDAIRDKGEAHSGFSDLWDNLLDFFIYADLFDPSKGFFTNALMGLKPGGRSGTMPSCPPYKEQCLHFLSSQVQIVNPEAVVILGGDAKALWRRAKRLYPVLQKLPSVEIMHPSPRHKDKKPTPELWKRNQGSNILTVLQSIPPNH